MVVVGTIAAVLLMINPLFRLHAHRAMSDVPYEAFLIAAMGLGLYALQRIWSGRSAAVTALLVVSTGLAVGLSILCKFNGLIGLMVIGCWVGFAFLAPRLSLLRKMGMAAAFLVMTLIACTHLRRPESGDDCQTYGESRARWEGWS